MRLLTYILFFSLIFSESETWYTNPLDYVLGRTTNRTTFREPVSFTPFDIKIGTFNYGGSDFWDQGFGANELGVSPILLDSSNYQYSGLSNANSRKCYLFEVDFLKYNIPNYVYKQNYIDIQFGLGMKMMGLIENPGIDLPDDFLTGSDSDPSGQDRGKYKYRPSIRDYNVNTTINWQFYDFILGYLSHSIGIANLSLYESEGGDKYLDGNGIGESFALGLKGMFNSRYDMKDYKVTYGAEAKWIRAYVDDLNDPNKISPITGFDMKGIGWALNFGIIFGGERSIGDEAYQSMLKNDFISAVSEFQEFLDRNPRHIKKIKAQKMLEFCKKQRPYQEFENGKSAFADYNLDQAARWYESAITTSDDDLSFEIITKQKELSMVFLDSAIVNLDDIGFNNAEKLIRKAKAVTPEIEAVANEYLSDLYMIKGDLFYEVKNYEAALKNYKKSYSYNQKDKVQYITKVKEVTTAILDEANKATDKGDILFALTSLSKLVELRPELESEFSFGIQALKEKLMEISYIKTKDHIESYIKSEKNKAKKRIYKKVEIGMKKNEVINLLGQPAFIENKFVDNEIKQLWFYFDELDDKYVNFYFESDILIKIDD
ncbi:MAG: hypothetical protein CMG59_04685 [Candidatus Marinimicrobia bacterium]|nr:hypothetical protein [Candidatus Neomarinimicrobiota bacterium]